MQIRDGFQKLTEFKKAKRDFLESIKSINEKKEVRLEESDSRVLASDLSSPNPIPSFERAAMDGFAVKASDTYGGGSSSPITLDLDKDPGDKGAEKVHTGSAIPSEADAVVKIEDTEKNGKRLQVFKAISPSENVDLVGEDVEEGELIFQKGQELRPFDLGLLRSLQVPEVEVFRRPRVLVVPTGNEVVPRDGDPGPGEVIESNSLVIKVIAERLDALVSKHDIVGDTPKRLYEALKKGKKFDLVVFSGGTSVGERDHTAKVVKEHGEISSHGIGIKPGKPTLLGMYDDIPVICLPGHPVACFISAQLFMRPALLKLANKKDLGLRSTDAYLSRKIESKVGFRTFTRVSIEGRQAVPIRTSGSGIQSTLTSSDGFVSINEETEGLDKGQKVEVFLFE
ncbi:MAG: Molybdopterin biosynthesis enzyme [Candidatus Methanohalarchaeum thermophilum]|uniref:Molybdopterin biosynthesis enzyme n=1 Tax=Methanohalarchaeum thermophilum TaxID=1903181 RepID=A0A1Q6DWA7_METT1|nr:MAG: Molybdopterin biosynthesis enzyme [Candidatus Methanohalarchaeum thermophilum]